MGGLTLPEIEAREPGVLARRERDKWDFVPPGGESYREVAERVGEWYAELTQRYSRRGARRRRAGADGATSISCREEEATHAEIAQGVVYVFADGTVARYA